MRGKVLHSRRPKGLKEEEDGKIEGALVTVVTRYSLRTVHYRSPRTQTNYTISLEPIRKLLQYCQTSPAVS